MAALGNSNGRNSINLLKLAPVNMDMKASEIQLQAPKHPQYNRIEIAFVDKSYSTKQFGPKSVPRKG